jgi:predicted aconitase
MLLADEEKRMYQGEYGLGIQRAVSLRIKYGELFGAEKMVNVAGRHICPNVLNALPEGRHLLGWLGRRAKRPRR